MTAPEYLFQNQTANTTGEPIRVSANAPGGFANRTILQSGDLDGGALTIEYSSTSRTSGFVVLPDPDALLPGPLNISIKAGWIRGVLAGGGGSLDVDVVVS